MEANDTSIETDLHDPDACPKCAGPLRERPLRRFPVVTQAIFGLSFIIFLMSYEKWKATPIVLYLWTAVQVGLGVALVRLRRLAHKRILICIRCGEPLR